MTIGDAGATDTLTTTLSGGGGTLADGIGFSGLTSSGPGAYALTGSATAITSELDALTFTPTAGQPNTSATTTFTLSDQSSAYATPTVDNTTTVTNTDPPAAPTLQNASIVVGSDSVNYVNSAGDTSSQVLTGTAAAGTTISLYLNGAATPYAPTTTAGDGTWSVPIGVLSDGTYSFVATATGVGGTTSPDSSPLAFTVDNDAGEQAATPPTLTTLVSFSGANGTVPAGSLIADASGDLFGTTVLGGANGDGSVFEIVNNNAGSPGFWRTTMSRAPRPNFPGRNTRRRQLLRSCRLRLDRTAAKMRRHPHPSTFELSVVKEADRPGSH